MTEQANIADLIADRDHLRAELVEANTLLRSAHSVADREGRDTNWFGLRLRLSFALDRQHTYINEWGGFRLGVCPPLPDEVWREKAIKAWEALAKYGCQRFIDGNTCITKGADQICATCAAREAIR